MAECVPGGWEPYRQPHKPADRIPGASPPHCDHMPGGAAVVEPQPAVDSDHHPDEQAGRDEGEDRNADDERLGGQEPDGNEEPEDEVGDSEFPRAEVGGGLCSGGKSGPSTGGGNRAAP
jgi:hypothetical protein